MVSPNDPILIQIAEAIPVNQITTSSTQTLIEQLLTLAYGEQKERKKALLVGLAAPQTGISKRIILVDIGADGHGGVSDLQVFINPEITWISQEKAQWYEGCFSTDRVCGIVERPVSVKVKAYNNHGVLEKKQYSGYTARIFQHEIDHLNGKEFITHISDENNLHWVEQNEFPLYRDHEAWRTWPNKCSFKKWEKIKGIRR